MKRVLQTACVFGCMLVAFSCKKADLSSNQASSPSPAVQKYVTEFGPQTNNGTTGNTGRNSSGECEPTNVTLIAGQTMDAGTVTVSNDAEYIYVTYTTTNGWVLTQTHLYVGDCALIPVNNPGNPLPGQFPYTSAHNNVTSYTYQVPISRIPLEGCGCIAAHAVVKKYNASNQVIDTQTGWGNGVRINLTGGNWGMKFDYCSCTP